MKVDYTEAGKASVRLALATYEGALERHRKEGERLNVGTLATQQQQGRIEILKRMFSTESKAETIELAHPVRIALSDALVVEIAECTKLEGKVQKRLVDVNDVERQITRLRKLHLQLHDQTALEMESSAPPAVEPEVRKGNGAPRREKRAASPAPKRRPRGQSDQTSL